MSETVITRSWTYEITAEPGTWPDAPRPHSQVVIRPHCVKVSIYQRGDGEPARSITSTCGFRVKKDGSLSKLEHERGNWPELDWLTAIEDDCLRKATAEWKAATGR